MSESHINLYQNQTIKRLELQLELGKFKIRTGFYKGQSNSNKQGTIYGKIGNVRDSC